jgi:hypothetical protein
MTKTYRKADGTTVTVSDEDYKKLQELSDDEIERRAACDPDALPLSEEELKKFKRAKPVTPAGRQQWVSSSNAPASAAK